MLDDLQPMAPELLWILCLGLLVAFLLAFSVGANDVSNSFGTSVGSKVLTVTQACILATIFEVAGATLLGYSVCDTFRTKLYDVEQYKGAQKELMLGALACLIGSAVWNLLATAFKMPISGTHSIVGATLGFSIVLKGFDSIKWIPLFKIIGSWFASPVLSGFISSIIYLVISKTVIRKVDPLKYGLKALPFFYGATIFINIASVVISGPEIFGLNTLSWYAGLFISLIISGVVICCVAMILVPRLRREILNEIIEKSKPNSSGPKRSKSFKCTTTSLSLPPISNGNVEKSAFDNSAFKPDVKAIEHSPPPQAAFPNGQTNELTLNPNQLELDRESLKRIGPKPPTAPKPPHLLKRQQAQEQQLEEIDLGPPNDLQKPKRPSITKENDIENADREVSGSNGEGSNGRPGMVRGERFEVFRLFSSLQILTACFASFAHGTNDVSNAVAPLVPIWNIYVQGSEDIGQPTQVWILAFGGIGICTGLWAWGRAVMATVGEGLTQLTPSKGFSIELGAAISVLCATKLGLPISTTHCKVGSVVIVGLISSKFCSQDNLLDMSEDEQAKENGKQVVDWKLFGNIAITWLVTVPLAATASAIVMIVLKWLALP